jgi:Flp pilus assembly protein TadD/cell division septation protein DedD
MSKQHVVALTLALLATACSTNSTGDIPSLATGQDRLAADMSPATLMRVGDATRAGGDATSAIALYRRAHEVAPNDPAPLVRIGATLAEVHAYSDAVEAYRQAVELAPKDAETRRTFGALLLSLDKPELALTHLEAALAAHQDPKLYNLIGVANDLLGRHDVAQRSYADGLRLAPDNGALSNNLGLSQALVDDFPSAIKTLGAAAARPQATPRTRLNLALVYGLAGDNDKAAAVARADLDEASVKSNLAYYAMLRGMDDRARAAAIVGGRLPSTPAPTPTPVAEAPSPAPTQKVAAVELAPLPTPPAAAAEPATAPVPKAPPIKHVVQHPVKIAPVTSEPAKSEPAVEPTAEAAEPPPAPAVKDNASKSAAVKNGVSAAGATGLSTAPPPAAPETDPRVPTAAIESPAIAATDPTPSVAKSEEPATPPTAAPSDGAAPLDTKSPVADATASPEPKSATPEAVATSEAADATAQPATPPSTTTASAAPEVAASAAPPQPATAPAHPRAGGRFLIQVGAFHDPVRAHKLCDELAAKGYDVAVSVASAPPARDWFYCRSTATATHADAAAAADRLRNAENAPALLIPASLVTKN